MRTQHGAPSLRARTASRSPRSQGASRRWACPARSGWCRLS